MYRRLRDEAPVYHHAGRDVWALSRWDDVQVAAKDWETFSSSVGGTGNDLDDTYQLFLPAGDLPAADPPLHTRLRGALRLAFSPSALKVRFEPAVRSQVRERIDAFADAGRADFARDLARPLPGTTMFTWFGFPEADHPRLLALFGDMLERTPGERALPPVSIAARDQLRAYILDVARERRAHPSDDLMTHLVRAEAAGELSRDELIGSSLLLFVAGITTTSGLISNSLLHLVRFPEARETMRRDPATIPAAVEELLRYEAPIQALGRTTTRPVELHGTTIPAGASVALIWASANRDERHWPDPDTLDIGRTPTPCRLRRRDPPLSRRAARSPRGEDRLRGAPAAHPGVVGRRSDRAAAHAHRPRTREPPRRLLKPASRGASRPRPQVRRRTRRRVVMAG